MRRAAWALSTLWLSTPDYRCTSARHDLLINHTTCNLQIALTLVAAGSGNGIITCLQDGAIPRVSVVVNTLLGGTYTQRCITALLAQKDAPPIEIIVPVFPSIDDLTRLTGDSPSVRVIVIETLPHGADPSDPRLDHLLYDRRRAAGIVAARGDIIALTEDQMIPDRGWCAALVKAHAAPYGAIGGAIGNAGKGNLHLALFLCDFGRYERPFQQGKTRSLTDQNVSYKRAPMERIRQVWMESYDETAVHQALESAGETLWLNPDLIVRHDRGPLNLRQQLRERFSWGRVFGGRRAQNVSVRYRAALLVLSPLIPALIVWRRVNTAYRKGLSPARILAATPALSVMALFWALGEAMGYLTGEPFPGLERRSRFRA